MARRTAAARLSVDTAPPSAAAPIRALRAGETRADHGPGAARETQAALAARLIQSGLEEPAPQWSRRRGLALAIGASSLLWLTLAVAVGVVLRH